MRSLGCAALALMLGTACSGRLEQSGGGSSGPPGGSGSGSSSGAPGPGTSVAPDGGSSVASEGGSTSGCSSGGSYASSSGGPTVGACSLPAEAAARWIAFDADRVANNRDIYVVLADGSQTVRLTSDPSTEADPAISNDGTTLAFVSDRSGTMQIYTMNLASKTVRQLTSLQAGADQPSWSRDDSQIAFHSAASVYLMNADGSNARILHSGDDSNLNADKHPSFSADDKQVIFDRGNEIDALDVDGTGFRYIVQNWTTNEEAPALSPDGVTVAFAVECSAVLQEQIEVTGFACYLSDPCKGEFVTPSMSPGPDHSADKPAWGPAGVIAFEHGNPASPGINGPPAIAYPAAIGVSVAPGSTPCDLVTGPGDSRNPNWAPAGFQPQ